MSRLNWAVAFLVAISFVPLIRAEEARPAPKQSAESAAADMAAEAQAFWAALTPEQQAKAGYKFDDEERSTWYFVPKVRKGLTIKEMTSGQRALAHALLASGLSQKGFIKAVTIMSLDDVLKVMEQGKQGAPTRDPELYYFTIFGQPGGKEPWGWRAEGHHLSLNFTIVDGKGIAAAPAFFGANPAMVKEGPRKGLRILGEEEDKGRAIIKSFNEEMRKKAIFNAEAPKEVVTSNQRKAMIDAPVGVAYSEMSEDQKRMLVDLVGDYADRHRGEIAGEDLKRINEASWDQVKFAWAGGIEMGQLHYYRIQGPTFLIEYDNTQNNGNHVHSVWRDLTRDFGEDLLLEHYKQTKHD
jgi:hypothetical protein